MWGVVLGILAQVAVWAVNRLFASALTAAIGLTMWWATDGFEHLIEWLTATDSLTGSALRWAIPEHSIVAAEQIVCAANAWAPIAEWWVFFRLLLTMTLASVPVKLFRGLFRRG